MAQAAALLSGGRSGEASGVQQMLQGFGKQAGGDRTQMLLRLKNEIGRTGLFRDGVIPEHTPEQIADVRWPGSGRYGPPPGDVTASLVAGAKGTGTDAVALVGNAVRPQVLSEPPEIRFASTEDHLYCTIAIDADAWVKPAEETPGMEEEREVVVERRAGQSLGMNITPFLRLNTVAPGSPAATAGLMPGMLILGIDGKKVADIAVGREALRAAGTKVVFRVRGIPPPPSALGSSRGGVKGSGFVQLLGLRVNIAGGADGAVGSNGWEWVEWQPPQLSLGTGLHRVVFVVARQSDLLNTGTLTQIRASEMAGRRGFDVVDWIHRRCSTVVATQVVVAECDAQEPGDQLRPSSGDHPPVSSWFLTGDKARVCPTTGGAWVTGTVVTPGPSAACALLTAEGATVVGECEHDARHHIDAAAA